MPMKIISGIKLLTINKDNYSSKSTLFKKHQFQATFCTISLKSRKNQFELQKRSNSR